MIAEVANAPTRGRGNPVFGKVGTSSKLFCPGTVEGVGLGEETGSGAELTCTVSEEFLDFCTPWAITK